MLAGAGLAVVAVVLIVAPGNGTPSARASIPAGGGAASDASDVELMRAVRARESVRAIAAPAGIPARGLAGGLEAHRGRAGTIVVEYRADRAPSVLQSVALGAARRLVDSLAAADVAAAEQRVVDAVRGAERATDAIADHADDTAVADAELALADARQRLATLQAQRDQAVAGSSPSASLLEQQVATTQAEVFDLQAVATRRGALVETQQRADAAVDAAEAARETARARVGSPAGAAPRLVVDRGTTGPPIWRMVLAGVLLVLAVGAFVAGTALLLRTRRTRARTGRRAPPGESATEPAREPTRPEGSDTAPRVELDEIKRRLAALQEHASDPG